LHPFGYVNYGFENSNTQVLPNSNMGISNTKQWFKIQTFSIQKRYLWNPNTNLKLFPTSKHTYPTKKIVLL